MKTSFRLPSLGMNCIEDKEYFWIAFEALRAPLPEAGTRPCRTMDSKHFYNDHGKLPGNCHIQIFTGNFSQLKSRATQITMHRYTPRMVQKYKRQATKSFLHRQTPTWHWLIYDNKLSTLLLLVAKNECTDGCGFYRTKHKCVVNNYEMEMKSENKFKDLVDGGTKTYEAKKRDIPKDIHTCLNALKTTMIDYTAQSPPNYLVGGDNNNEILKVETETMTGLNDLEEMKAIISCKN